MKYYLITTDHLTDRLLFRDDDDFRTGMNYLAITTFVLKANLLAFILMSNHIHIVTAGTANQAKALADRFKQMYGRYFSRKYGNRDFLRRLGVDIRELKVEDESLPRGIAYVQMNCVAANITPHPALYPWGTGACFFKETRERSRPLGSMSRRDAIRLLRSNISLPDDFRVGDEGYILPECYIIVKHVERLFRTPKRYSYFLGISSKSRQRLEKEAVPAFRDQVILEGMNDLCRSLFRCHSLNDLADTKKAELMRQLRRRFNPDINQLARVTGIPYPEIAAMLDSFG